MDKLVMHDLRATDPAPQHSFVDHGPQRRRSGLIEDALPVKPRRDQLIDLVVAFGGLPRLEQGPAAGPPDSGTEKVRGRGTGIEATCGRPRLTPPFRSWR